MSLRNLIISCIVGILWSCAWGLHRPAPRYSQQFIPETSFTCRNKIVGSYYADPETDCQLFHVCVSVAGIVHDYKFLCPNDTAFDQESQTCADWYDVDCEAATLYYASDNFDLYRIGSGLESVHYDSIRSDSEPLDQLQRSESNDPVRSAVNSLNRDTPTPTYTSQLNSNRREIIRNSNNNNFYSSPKNARDEDYHGEKGYQHSIIETKRKSEVSHLTRKQQIDKNKNVSSNIPVPSATITYPNENSYTSFQRITYGRTTVRPTPSYNNYKNNRKTSQSAGGQHEMSTMTIPGSTYDYLNTHKRLNHTQKSLKETIPSTSKPSFIQQYSYSSSTTVSPIVYNKNNERNADQPIESTTMTSFLVNQYFNHGTSTRPTMYTVNYQDNYSSYNEQHNTKNDNVSNQKSQVSRTQPTMKYPTSDMTVRQENNYNNIQRSTTSIPVTSTFYDTYNLYNSFVEKTKKNNAQSINNKYYENLSSDISGPTTDVPATEKLVEKKGKGDFTSLDNGQYFSKPYIPTFFANVTKAPRKIMTHEEYSNTRKYFETSTTDYDFKKSSVIEISPSSINLLAGMVKTTTPVRRRNGLPTTYNPGSVSVNNEKGFQQSTTPRIKTTKKNDYDYAYYDNGGAVEYDGLDVAQVTNGKEPSKIPRI